MISLQRKQSGFTIVELLIVIVVIGILAGLVIVTFSGIQTKARNTERTTDIKAVQNHLEAYFAQNGKYPTLANMNDSSFRSTNMKGFDAEAVKDPKDTAATPTFAAAAAANVYSYVVTPANCDNGANGDCTGYTLTTTYEGGGTYVRTNLN